MNEQIQLPRFPCHVCGNRISFNDECVVCKSCQTVAHKNCIENGLSSALLMSKQIKSVPTCELCGVVITDRDTSWWGKTDLRITEDDDVIEILGWTEFKSKKEIQFDRNSLTDFRLNQVYPYRELFYGLFGIPVLFFVLAIILDLMNYPLEILTLPFLLLFVPYIVFWRIKPYSLDHGSDYRIKMLFKDGKKEKVLFSGSDEKDAEDLRLALKTLTAKLDSPNQ
jgi:hypothetical protein